MSQTNPYQPPAANVQRTIVKRPLGLLDWLLIAFIALQVVLAALYLPSTLEKVRTGEMAIISFLLVGLSVFFMALGAVLFALKARAPIYTFAIATAFIVLALWQSYGISLLYVASAALSIGACAYSIVLNRQINAADSNA